MLQEQPSESTSIKAKAYSLVKGLMNQERIPGNLMIKETLVSSASLAQLQKDCICQKTQFLYEHKAYIKINGTLQDRPFHYLLIMNHGDNRSLTWIE